jgi:hypothetical protein
MRRLLSTLRRRRAFNRGVGGFYLFSALSHSELAYRHAPFSI